MPSKMSHRLAPAVLVPVALVLALPVAAQSQSWTAASTTRGPAPARHRAPPPAHAIPALASSTPPAVADSDASRDVVARVGSSDLTADDIRAYVATLDVRTQAALQRDPALLSQAVRLLLANRLVLQEALARKWDQQPNVATALQHVRDNAIVELYLQSVSAPPPDYPGDAEIQKTYDANRNALLVPRQFDLAQIFIAVPRGTDPAAAAAARKKIDDIEAKLRRPGADFSAIASSDAGVQNGGLLGWLPEPQIRPEILAKVMGLPKNAVSEPIQLDDGWHIIKLIDTKAAYTPTLPEVRAALVQRMRAERAEQMRRAYLADLLKQHPPELNELALSNLLTKPAQ